ncbi:start-like domain protein [Fusarium beomiforme]|uniref:Start-like domain protein n=1 Tax=Fusarium beomiforme TaxID=44412 RepID=A0A9P5AK82_9HYPO|nr:start-like domain protein [Fusarium beomiforme]
METAKAIECTTPIAKHSLGAGRVVFTAGSTITIDVPAKEAFGAIVGFDKYHEWNTWTPKLTFTDMKAEDAVEPGANGILEVMTDSNGNLMEIPIEARSNPLYLHHEARLMLIQVLELRYGKDECKLVWKTKYPPWWAATIERVQVVTPKGPNSCEVKNWESMGGLAAYAMKLSWVAKDLETANLKYLDELAAFARKGVSNRE